MSADYIEMITHLFAALFAGGAIGLERSYHGRPAGFRTHALVCLASSLLMTVTFYQAQWLPDTALNTIRADPTRMAQGIMTGIGFLGAGVIFKEGLSVRGLTTAASIWITAAIGIMMGVGFYLPAIVAVLLSLGTLSVFRLIEAKMPSRSYIHHQVSFGRNQIMSEPELLQLLNEQGFIVSNISYRADDEHCFEYRMILYTGNPDNISRLVNFWVAHQEAKAFRISPTGD